MLPTSISSSYVCDTIPPARLAPGDIDDYELSTRPTTTTDPTITVDDIPMVFESTGVLDDVDTTPQRSSSPESESHPQPPPRKLCVRHQRMADEGTNLKLQQSLDALPLEEREAVNAVWSNFSSSSHPRRALILQGLLTMCCFSQLSLLTEQLSHLIRIDPFTVLPHEVSLKILGYLDATSLCRAAQVTRKWKNLADDNTLWRNICEQHIGQKCRKCGWGLPVLEKKRAYRRPRSHSPCPPTQSAKRALEESSLLSSPIKRHKSELSHFPDSPASPSSSSSTLRPSRPALQNNRTTPLLPQSLSESLTRPWKDVYSERMTIELNWRRGRCTVRTLKGHTDGVMCLQFCETLPHPSFPVLITGSYDRTVRVWNLETGVELHCMKGHTRAVRALQFDEAKLITGSMDNTIKVWDWRRGRCIRTLTGHTEGVVCLNFDSNVLASGSVDSTVKVWNLRTGGAFTLRGHHDWVNAVQLWDSDPGSSLRNSTSNTGNSFMDVSGSGSPRASGGSPAPQIDPGKMLFSASDDGTIKLWDLTMRTCVRQFTGHIGQVQSMKLLLADDCDDETQELVSPEGDLFDGRANPKLPRSLSQPPAGVGAHRGGLEESLLLSNTAQPSSALIVNSGVASASHLPSTSTSNLSASSSSSSPSGSGTAAATTTAATSRMNRKKPMLISGSLDNSIKIWDIETGQTVQTLFGHIEGVWAVASDKLRLVSGSHDRTIKVWSREDGSCTTTLVGHQAAVSCLALGEDKIVSGSDDCDIKIWSFSEE